MVRCLVWYLGYSSAICWAFLCYCCVCLFRLLLSLLALHISSYPPCLCSISFPSCVLYIYFFLISLFVGSMHLHANPSCSLLFLSFFLPTAFLLCFFFFFLCSRIEYHFVSAVSTFWRIRFCTISVLIDQLLSSILPSDTPTTW